MCYNWATCSSRVAKWCRVYNRLFASIIILGLTITTNYGRTIIRKHLERRSWKFCASKIKYDHWSCIMIYKWYCVLSLVVCISHEMWCDELVDDAKAMDAKGDKLDTYEMQMRTRNPNADSKISIRWLLMPIMAHT